MLPVLIGGVCFWMLIVETIANIRRLALVQGKSIKQICREVRVSPRNRMNDKRSLIRYSVRSSESEWLACRIKTLNIRM